MFDREPSPFIYPAGKVARFDPSHILAGGCTLSAIAVNGNFRNLLTGQVGSIQGSVSHSINAAIGPSILCATSSDGINIPGLPVVTTASVTIAAIFVPSALATNGTIIETNSANVGPVLQVTNIGTYKVSMRTTVNTENRVGFDLSVGVPYFFTGSLNTISTTQILTWAMTKLDTGQIISGSSTVSSAITSGGSTYQIGNRALTVASGQKIHAVMVTNKIRGEAEHFKAAENPWSLWY